MDVEDKIKDYSFEDLKVVIARDAVSSNMLDRRYAVRFIMLDNFDTYRELKQYLKDEIGVELLELENLMIQQYHEKDIWITIDEVRKAFKSLTKTTLVTPFSELARFYQDDEFSNFFNELSLLEDIQNPTKRIYVPLIGLQNRMTGFLNRFSRIEESAPIWRCNTRKQEIHVYVSRYKGFSFPSGNVNNILSTFYDWLRFWKTTAPQAKIVCTAEPILANYEQSKPDNIFRFTPIENAFKFITKFLEINLPFGYEEKDKSYWERLLEGINKLNPSSFSFYHYVEQHFNRQHFDADDIIQEWGNSHCSAYDRWLLRQYVFAKGDSQFVRYFLRCLSESSVMMSNELFENIARLIMLSDEDVNNMESADQRKKLMLANTHLFVKCVSQSTQSWLQNKIIVLEEQNSIERALKLCTGTFDFEKRLFLSWFCKYNQSGQFTINHLELYYPEMAAYLMSVQPYEMKDTQRWVNDYFKKYRFAKIIDAYSDDLAKMIKERNADEQQFYKWYHSFENSHNLLFSEQVDKVYWIDGLCAEFYPLINYLVASMKTDLHIEKSLFSRADLPSATVFNRFEGDNVVKFSDLDEIAHSAHHYQPQLTLIEEIQTIQRIIHQIIADNQSTSNRIVIVSDHGLSCMSRKVESKKISKQTEHEGRYFEVTDSSLKSDSDFIVHTNESNGKRYCVALRHASLGSKPSREVHGGCCPEEVIVPFVIISNKEKKCSTYSIEIINETIPLSEPLVELRIVPRPQSVQIEVEGKEYNLSELQNMNWCVKLEDITEGIKQIKVLPYKGNVFTTKIEVYGMGFNNSIDDLFN